MKPRIPRLTGSLLALSSLLLTGLSSSAGTPSEKNPAAKEALQTAPVHPMYLGMVSTGIKTNDSYTDGNFSIVAPIWSSLGADSTLSGGLLFIEPYVSYGEGGEVATSLGLGYRHLFGSQSVSALTNHDGHQAGFFEEGVFVGANMFVDMLDTEANNQFWQLGVGLEAGTRYVEVRGNYYIPLSDKQLADEFRTRESFQSTSSQAHQSVTPLDNPTAAGNAITQNALYSTSVTTTTRTTTIERLFRRYEEGMEGWDAEIAVLIPWLDRYMDVTLIGGYYSFDNQPFGPQSGGTGNVEGWKAGVQVRPVPAVLLSGTWYEDERLTGSDWTVGMQLQVPFEAGDLGDGKNFWSRIGDSFKPRRRHLIERLAEPVHRQNAAVKLASSVEEEETSTSTKVQRVTKVVSQRQGQVVLADDVVFVNNGEAVGNGIQAGTSEQLGANGTAEKPFDTISEGANLAGSNANLHGKAWTVYTQGGTGFDYEDAVELSGSTKFVSSFNTLTGVGGRTFGGNTERPVLYGGFYAQDIPFVQVTGYDIREGLDGAGIIARNVQDLVVTQNHFSAYGAGVYIETECDIDATASIRENSFFTGEHGVKVETYGRSNLTLLVDNNDFAFESPLLRKASGAMQVIMLDTYDRSTLTSVISGNNFSGFIHTAVEANSYDRSTQDLTIVDNVLDGYFFNGFRVTSYCRSTLDTNIEGNTLLGYYEQDGIELDGRDRSRFTGLVKANNFAGEFEDGLDIDKTERAFLDVDVEENIFSGFFSDSMIELTGNGDRACDPTEEKARMVVDVVNNMFSGDTQGRGIDIDNYDRNRMELTVVGNTFSGEFDQALDAGQNDSSQLVIDVTNNILSGDFDSNGIRFTSNGIKSHGVLLDGTIENNVLSGAFGSVEAGAGIELQSNDTSLMNVTIDNNQLSGVFYNGINVLRDEYSSLNVDVTNNLLSGAFEYAGINLDADGTGSNKLNATVTGNVLTGSFARGITMDSYNGAKLDVELSNNQLIGDSTYATYGIYIRSSNSSVLTVTQFDGNTISGASQTGIRIRRNNTSTLSVNGTLDEASSNHVSNENTEKVENTGSTSGQFYLNGQLVTLPTTVP
ncbi:inverse autotransporter beta domain-containing protein [Roseimicrobium gellanilyticum]|nr:inverse autotransporter beta domain-containing protein [Roseimicrobium gellanilyticum]